MDACTNHACENGATCKVTGKDSYRCQCPNGYFGDNCEKGTADKNGKNWAAALVLLSHLLRKKRLEFVYIHVVVQLYPFFKFYFPLFQLIIICEHRDVIDQSDQ